MIVAVPRESHPGESRVALVPASLPPLIKAGLEILIEAGAGAAAGFTDQQYIDKGAKIAPSRRDVFAADVVLQVRAAGANPQAGHADLELYRSGQVVIGMCDPLGDPKLAAEMAARGVSLFSLEMLPRITRAQSMDVLSSQANIAGYRAVLLAAEALPKMFPMMITAAGTINAARVFVIGAGVAGLQAIATARRLGASVCAYDVRPAVKEQVQSLGGRFIELPIEAKDAEDKRGYAKQQDESFFERQRELLIEPWLKANHREMMDAVIRGSKGRLLEEAGGILWGDDRHWRCAVHQRNQIRRCCRTGAWIQHLNIEIAGLCWSERSGQLGSAVEGRGHRRSDQPASPRRLARHGRQEGHRRAGRGRRTGPVHRQVLRGRRDRQDL